MNRNTKKNQIICLVLNVTLIFQIFFIPNTARSDDQISTNVHIRKHDRIRQAELVKPVELQPDGRCNEEFLSEFLDQQNCLRTPNIENCEPMLAGIAAQGTGAALGYLISKKLTSTEKKAQLADYNKSRKQIQAAGFALYEIDRQAIRSRVEAGKQLLISMGIKPEKYLTELSNSDLSSRSLPSHAIGDAFYNQLTSKEKAKIENPKHAFDLIQERAATIEREFIKSSTNRTVQNLVKTVPVAETESMSRQFDDKLWRDMIAELKKWELTPSQGIELEKLEAKAKASLSEADRDDPYKLRLKVNALAQEQHPQLYKKLSVLSSASPTFLSLSYIQPRSKFSVRPLVGATLGAIAGSSTMAGLNSVAKSNVGRCYKTLNLSPGEIELLKSYSVNLTYENCQNIRINNPREVIHKSYEAFGFVPRGLCKMILREDQVDKKFLEMQNLKIDEQNCEHVTSGPFKIEKKSTGSSLECKDEESKVTYQVQLNPDNEIVVGQPGGKVVTKAYVKNTSGVSLENSDYAKAFEGVFVGGVKINPMGLSSDLTNIRLRTHDEIYQSLTSRLYENPGHRPNNFIDRCYAAYVGLKTISSSQLLTGLCNEPTIGRSSAGPPKGGEASGGTSEATPSVPASK